MFIRFTDSLSHWFSDMPIHVRSQFGHNILQTEFPTFYFWPLKHFFFIHYIFFLHLQSKGSILDLEILHLEHLCIKICVYIWGTAQHTRLPSQRKSLSSVAVVTHEENQIWMTKDHLLPEDPFRVQWSQKFKIIKGYPLWSTQVNTSTRTL